MDFIHRLAKDKMFRFAQNTLLGGRDNWRMNSRVFPDPPKPKYAGKQFPEYMKWKARHEAP